MVTDFSAEDKASGVKFCTANHHRALPLKLKIGRIGQRAGHAHPYVNITAEMRRRKRHARNEPFVKSRGVWT